MHPLKCPCLPDSDLKSSQIDLIQQRHQWLVPQISGFQIGFILFLHYERRLTSQLSVSFSGELVGHKDLVSGFSFCRHAGQSHICVSSSADGSVCFWDSDKKALIKEHAAHQVSVDSCCFVCHCGRGGFRGIMTPPACSRLLCTRRRGKTEAAFLVLKRSLVRFFEVADRWQLRCHTFC